MLLEHVTQSSAYEGMDTSVSYDLNKYMGNQDPTTNPEAIKIADVNQYNSAEHHADGNGDIATVENKEPEQTQYEEPLVATSMEEEQLWGIEKANSADFTAWTSLIQQTEKTAEDHLPKNFKVYDAFLAEFPLCYGYWKKYADHEARLGSAEKILEVYERAVQVVTYSVNIMMHYAMFAMATYEDPEIIRSIDSTCLWRKKCLQRRNTLCLGELRRIMGSFSNDDDVAKCFPRSKNAGRLFRILVTL